MRKLLKSWPNSDQKPHFLAHWSNQHNPSPVTVVPIESSLAATPAATPTKPSPSKAPSPSHERPSPRSTLASQAACEGTTNSAMARTTTGGPNGKAAPSTTASSLSPHIPNRMNSTIRTVPNFDDRQSYPEDDSSIDGVQSHSTSRDSGFSSSTLNSTTSMGSAHSQQRAQAPSGGVSRIPSHNKLKPSPSGGASQDNGDGTPDGTPKTLRTIPSLAETPPREAATTSSTTPTPTIANTDPGGGGGSSANNDMSHPAAAATEANPSSSSPNASWDSSVGKAGLGKTGRVINRLVSDNESLKRDIQIERLRAEESRSAARLLEDKLERVISDYESRLLEASVTKTLLARKERQVESLQDAVELERKRALDAAARERVCKDEMERAVADAKRQVDEATNYAALCEGRYQAISGHWKDQGEEVKRAMGKMRAEVEELVGERKKDDEKIETLRELCDQQDGNIRELMRQKDEIAAQFERYKRQQEEDLRGIKTRADQREQEQERTLREAREALDKLRWALSVKQKIDWAQ